MLAGLLIAAIPLSSWARESFEQAVEKAIQHIERFEYEESLKPLEHAGSLVSSEEQKTLIMLLTGIALYNMGQNSQHRAEAAFKDALTLSPHARLPIKTTAHAELFFEQTKTRFSQELASRSHALIPPAPPAQPFGDVGPESGRLTVAPLVPGIVGIALLLSGGVFWGMAKSEQLRIQNDESSLTTIQEARLSASRGKTYQTLGLGLTGAGVLALGSSVVLYVAQTPKASVTLGAGTDGTSAFLRGTWP
jgi:hypothetical protein